ncbi:ribonuclease HI family protein [bacterium]|jgi:ribonuclease HI|nr:ribonuclease HI family protein [bacterium]MBT5015225.1 ribonuclease HI family protein [bacterium]
MKKPSKQLNLFGQSEPDATTHEKRLDKAPWKMFIDGASRNNPGPSAVGIHLSKDKTAILNEGFFTGIKTNNQAEYLALIIGVILTEQQLKPFDRLEINADSQLLVRQMEGVYKIKNNELKKYAACAQQLLEPYTYTIKHVFREQNTIADALANKGLDQKIIPSDAIIKRLKKYDIIL